MFYASALHGVEHFTKKEMQLVSFDKPRAVIDRCMKNKKTKRILSRGNNQIRTQHYNNMPPE